MAEYRITMNDTQEAELAYLAGTEYTKEQTAQALIDQKLADLYPNFLIWQDSETWRKIQKLEAEDKEALAAAIAKVDAAEAAEKDAAEVAAAEPEVP